MHCWQTSRRTHRRIVVPDDGYDNTRALARLVGGATGVEVVAVDLLDAAAVDQGLAGGAPRCGSRHRPTRSWASPTSRNSATSPAATARRWSLTTPSRPRCCSSRRASAAATVYSLTKPAAGHSDLLLGAVVTRDAALADRLRQ